MLSIGDDICGSEYTPWKRSLSFNNICLWPSQYMCVNVISFIDKADTLYWHTFKYTLQKYGPSSSCPPSYGLKSRKCITFSFYKKIVNAIFHLENKRKETFLQSKISFDPRNCWYAVNGNSINQWIKKFLGWYIYHMKFRSSL